MVASELGSQGYGIFGGVISALKDIIHHRAANVPDHEAIRSTIISACCGPDVTFQALSKMLGIYGNRNYMKLEGGSNQLTIPLFLEFEDVTLRAGIYIVCVKLG